MTAYPGRSSHRYDAVMGRSVLAVVAVGIIHGAAAAVAADGGEADAVREARARYAGTWKVVSIESDGNRSAQEGRSIVVTNAPDGSWTLTVDGREVSRGTSRMDPLATPAEIDIEVTEGEGRGGTLLGIYEVTDTTRRLCFRGSDGWRPREFATTQGCGAVLVTFERK